jgi:aminocarboxymuconate-semialdehyde decarboxylase
MPVSRRTVIGGAAALGAVAATASSKANAAPSAPVIDVHTHMYSEGWMDVVNRSKNDNFYLGPNRALMYRGQGIGRISDEMLDYDLRIKDMDAAGVDVALISLTAPNVYWGTPKENAAAARAINNDFRAAAEKYDGRIRWMASLPMQDERDALQELIRAKATGAIGICTLTNILGTPLTHSRYKNIWREVEAMGLPVFVHPTTPYEDGMGLSEYGLANTIGFTSESSLAFARMIYDGFFDEFPNINMIACHGGGGLPFLLGRFDRMWEKGRTASKNIERPPSTYIHRIYFDSIVYDDNTMKFLIEQVGADNVMYGSDYPFTIGDMKGIRERVDRLPTKTANKVRSENAQKIFDL